MNDLLMYRLRLLCGWVSQLMLCVVLASGLGLVFVVNAYSQQSIHERSGSSYLPPVDIHRVSLDAMEEGVFRLKFSSEALRQIKANAYEKGNVADNFTHVFLKNADGILETGLAAFDSLSKAHSLVEARPVLDMLYEASPASLQHKARHQAWGFHLWYEFETTVKTDLAAVLSEYAKIPEILIAEPVYKIKSIGSVTDSLLRSEDPPLPVTHSTWTPDDPDYASKQWHYNNTGQVIGGTIGLEGADISMPEAWSITKGNPSVIVAVIDGGVQINHPDIAANMWPGIGYNFVDDDATITPDNHGTHVAGTIAAVSNNSTGVAGIAGGDGSGNGVQIMTCQIFKGTTSGGVAQAMIYAADNGAAISQNSWGYEDSLTYSQLHLDAIDYFNANGGGSVMDGGISIFAAGNSNSQVAWYPAYYDGAFAVAATNNLDQRSGFSNYGEWIDVSAPGSLVFSTRTSSSYGAMSGTSMACPHVSGVAALILSLAPGQFNANEVAGIIKNSTDDHYAHNPDYDGLLGTGRLNAHAALDLTISLLGGVLNPYAFEAEATGTSQIMLTWYKNKENEPVMIAWSPDGIFGTPVDGTSYSAGQSIAGGGIVLYKGGNTIYSHSGLTPNTQYAYRAWSYNSDNNYSSGVTNSSKTECLTQILPLTEVFSEGIIPPSCWSVIDKDGDGKNWFIGSSGYFPQVGSYVAVSESYLNGHGSLEPDNWLVSPRFSMSSDYLRITYWIKALDAEYAEETYHVLLSTTGKEPTDFNEIISETLSDDQWQQRVLQIPNMSGEQAYIAFRHYGSTDQYQLLIDNINLEESMTPMEYSITATSGTGGSITPSGTVLVPLGQNQSFTIAANTSHEIEDVFVDGVSIGPQASYSFNNVQSDHTLSAVFTPKTFTITASAGSGGSISPSGSVAVSYGENQSFTIAANTAYQIEDVFVDGESIGPQSFYTFNNLQSDHTISAIFTPKTYTITASADSGGSITPSGSLEVSHGQDQSFSISSGSGYVIHNVYVDGNSVGPVGSYAFTDIQSDHSIYAAFSPETHSINTHAGPGGSISPTGPLSVDQGQNQTFSIIPDTGYHIVSVLVDGHNIGPQTSYRFTNVSEDHFIEAWFAINTYTIMATAGQGGTISPVGELELEYGDSQSYAITADPGYHIVEVLVDGVSQGPADAWVFEAVSMDHQIEASFAISTYTITATASSGGTISPTGELVLEHGDSQSYAITAETGYHIVDVLVDEVSQGPVDAWVFEAVSTDHQIEASFSINTYTITATAGEGGTISPTGELVLDHGGSQSYAITAEAGYHIVDVLVDEVSKGPVDAWVFEAVSTDHQIEAFFAINTYTITATAGEGGTISPTGELVLEYGGSQSYAITADAGYHIVDVLVDEVSKGPVDAWVFEAVSTDHQIEAFFAINTYTITATAGEGGTISPTGELVLEHGGSQSYAITAEAGFHIADVLVDGVSQGPVDAWLFEAVSTDHQIEAFFAINTYTITATAGEGGTISPTGELVLEHGGSQSYAITAEAGYHIVEVLVDGVSQGPADEWVFEAVSMDHQIEASFAISTYTITATASSGGTISPTGELVLEHGSSQSYTITAEAGYHIADVLVDGVSQGPVTAWLFDNIGSDHSIHAKFERVYVVAFYIDMQYAEGFNSDTDYLYLFGSMFDWRGDGGLIDEKASVYEAPHLVYKYETELSAGSYEYLYYLNTYPAGAEWEEEPFRSFTVPDTLEVYDLFGYRTDPTTVPEITTNGLLNIYPNPAKENMTVESNLTIDRLQIYDVNGRMIQYAEPDMARYDLNIGGWPDGVYFIRAEAQGIIFTSKVVVKN